MNFHFILFYFFIVSLVCLLRFWKSRNSTSVCGSQFQKNASIFLASVRETFINEPRYKSKAQRQLINWSLGTKYIFYKYILLKDSGDPPNILNVLSRTPCQFFSFFHFSFYSPFLSLLFCSSSQNCLWTEFYDYFVCHFLPLTCDPKPVPIRRIHCCSS